MCISSCTEYNSLAYFIYSKSGLKFLVNVPIYFAICIIDKISLCYKNFYDEYPSLTKYITLLLCILFLAFISVLSIHFFVGCLTNPNLCNLALNLLFVPFAMSFGIISLLICVIAIVYYVYCDLNKLFINWHTKNQTTII